jgi:ribonuclease HI
VLCLLNLKDRKMTNRIKYSTESREPVGGYVVAYCDGSCGSQDHVGGWGYVVHDGLEMHEHFGHAFGTTNNQMEMVAAIEALECMLALGMHRRPVLVCTDSQYITNGSQNEAVWRNNDKVKNLATWKQLWNCMGHFRHLSFAWVRGHSGHYYNEHVDRLAARGRQRALKMLTKATATNYGA